LAKLSQAMFPPLLLIMVMNLDLLNMHLKN